MVTRLAHRLGLRQETVWARLGELRKGRRQPETVSVPAEPSERSEGKSGPAVRAERQLLELLLAEPVLVATAAGQITPEQVAHTGLRLILTELYALHETGQVPDLDALRVRLMLLDRPDLVEAAQRLQFVGRHTQDRPDYLRRVLNWFETQRHEAEKKVLKDQLAAGADDEQAKELLRQVMARTAATTSH
jgi:DNA primase